MEMLTAPLPPEQVFLTTAEWLRELMQTCSRRRWTKATYMLCSLDVRDPHDKSQWDDTLDPSSPNFHYTSQQPLLWWLQSNQAFWNQSVFDIITLCPDAPAKMLRLVMADIRRLRQGVPSKVFVDLAHAEWCALQLQLRDLAARK